MTRNKPKDYNLIREAILKNCVEPKSLNQLAKILGIDRNIVYRATNHLIDGHCLKNINENQKKVTEYQTVSFDYTPPPSKNNYKDKTHKPSIGGRIYTLDAPFDRDVDSYQMRHLETQRLRDSERSRARTYVGISTIYND